MITAFWAVVLACAAVALVCGEIAAVTVWIPHAGAHGHAPTTLGCVALYALFVAASVYCWSLIGWLALGVLAGG